MYYTKHIHDSSLGIVGSIVELRFEIDEPQNGVYCIPDNHGELLVNLGDDLEVNVLSTPRKDCIQKNQLALFNCRSRGCLLKTEGTLHVYSIKILPGWVNRLAPSSLHRDEFAMLEENIESYSIEDVCAFVEKRLDGSQPDKTLLEAVDLIREGQGGILIKDLYDALDVSKSTLEQKFIRELGITPKEFCKVEKMQRFLSNYYHYHSLYNLTQLTIMSGYFDQSHFIKDFRYFMDMTPGRFLKQNEEQLEVMMAA